LPDRISDQIIFEQAVTIFCQIGFKHLQTEIGFSLVLTAWIIRTDEDFPRLINCYPIDK